MRDIKRQFDPKDCSSVVAGKTDVPFVDIDNNII